MSPQDTQVATSFATVILLALTLIVAAWYAWETRRLANETIELRYDELAPHLVVTVVRYRIWHSGVKVDEPYDVGVEVRVRNIGRGPAVDVEVNCPEKDIEDKHPAFLAPGADLSLMVGAITVVGNDPAVKFERSISVAYDDRLHLRRHVEQYSVGTDTEEGRTYARRFGDVGGGRRRGLARAVAARRGALVVIAVAAASLWIGYVLRDALEALGRVQ